VHVSERLLLHEGALLERSLKAIEGRLIRSPRSEQHHPDRERLAIRFEEFKRAAKIDVPAETPR
jgi:putative restriction endonuclease